MANERQQKLISYERDGRTCYTSCRLLAFKRQYGIGFFEYQLKNQPKLKTN